MGPILPRASDIAAALEGLSGKALRQVHSTDSRQQLLYGKDRLRLRFMNHLAGHVYVAERTGCVCSGSSRSSNRPTRNVKAGCASRLQTGRSRIHTRAQRNSSRVRILLPRRDGCSPNA